MTEYQELERRLRLHLQSQIAAGRIHGARYCVSVKGRMVVSGELGTAEPLTELQSVTKLFTAVAILQLQERGRLRLTDPVAKFLPEFTGKPFSEITILHLLTHTSGLVALRDAFPERDTDWEAGIDRGNVAGSWIPAILKKGLFFTPGSRWEYSKAGFCILGEVIRRLTGQRAEDYIRERILLPCEMKKSCWRAEPGSIWNTVPQTAAGLLAPVEELVQFGVMLAEGGLYKGERVLTKASLCALETNQLPEGMQDFCWDHGGRKVAYGAGCPVYVPGYEPWWTVGERTIYHGGSGACMLLVNRAEKLAAAWSVPFADRGVWIEEAVKGTADVIGSYRGVLH